MNEYYASCVIAGFAGLILVVLDLTDLLDHVIGIGIGTIIAALGFGLKLPQRLDDLLGR